MNPSIENKSFVYHQTDHLLSGFDLLAILRVVEVSLFGSLRGLWHEPRDSRPAFRWVFRSMSMTKGLGPVMSRCDARPKSSCAEPLGALAVCNAIVKSVHLFGSENERFVGSFLLLFTVFF